MQNNFFGSKLNTFLLLVLIVLMILALKEMRKNQEFYKQNLNLGEQYKIPISDTAYEKDTPNSYDNMVSLDLSDEHVKAYKTIFTEALKKPANFNGHYVVVSYGCGSGCLGYSVVDKITGKAYKGPNDDYANSYQIPNDFDSTRYSLNSDLFKVHGYTEIETYKFENNKFILVN